MGPTILDEHHVFGFLDGCCHWTVWFYFSFWPCCVIVVLPAQYPVFLSFHAFGCLWCIFWQCLLSVLFLRDLLPLSPLVLMLDVVLSLFCSALFVHSVFVAWSFCLVRFVSVNCVLLVCLFHYSYGFFVDVVVFGVLLFSFSLEYTF